MACCALDRLSHRQASNGSSSMADWIPIGPGALNPEWGAAIGDLLQTEKRQKQGQEGGVR